MSKKLPDGWLSIKLDQLFEPRSTRVSPRDMPDAPYIGLEHVEAQTSRLLTTVPAATMSSSAARFFAGDVLYGRMRPYLNKVVQPQFDGLASAEFIVFPTLMGINNKFIHRRLSAGDFVDFACSQYEGDRPRVKFDQLGKFELALPPAAEQTRIVEKLEELLFDLDAGVAELKAAQKKLGQYRQSLLKAAVEGALTADWREAQRKHTTLRETGAQLLQRILTERRARWEAKQLAKFAEQGKIPPKDWQKKYPEPARLDTSGLPELPEGWVWASLEQLLSQLRSGTAETSGRDATFYPVLKSSAVRQGAIDFSAVNFLQESQCHTDNFLEVGDLLITRLSGSVEYVGCAAVVAEHAATSIQYPDRIFCGKLAFQSTALSAHIVTCLSGPVARQRIEAAAKSTAGHKRIALSDLLPFPIPLPATAEISEIKKLVETGLQQLKSLHKNVDFSCKQSAAQRKNILKAAFSGQLVPQDPNDEPASVLLERIRAERAAQVAVKKPYRSKRKEIS